MPVVRSINLFGPSENREVALQTAAPPATASAPAEETPRITAKDNMISDLEHSVRPRTWSGQPQGGKPGQAGPTEGIDGMTNFPNGVVPPDDGTPADNRARAGWALRDIPGQRTNGYLEHIEGHPGTMITPPASSGSGRGPESASGPRVGGIYGAGTGRASGFGGQGKGDNGSPGSNFDNGQKSGGPGSTGGHRHH